MGRGSHSHLRTIDRKFCKGDEGKDRFSTWNNSNDLCKTFSREEKGDPNASVLVGLDRCHKPHKNTFTVDIESCFMYLEFIPFT